jgi:hypothetical protein
MAAAYFPGHAPELATSLDSYLAELAIRLGAASFAPAVTVLALGGGYGRGEGGIFHPAPGTPPALYNDLEFYIVLHDASATGAAHAWSDAEAHRGEVAVGIEVEFKILSAAALESARPSMFYYDLVVGHRLVWGDAAFLPSLLPRLGDPAQIPAHEATRLLFNRGSGLFYAQCALALHDSRVADGFVERNHAKCRLALADAVLALNGRYHGSCRERTRRLVEPLAHLPPQWPTLQAWHREGVEFKLHPRHRAPDAAILRTAQEELTETWRNVFRWVEGHRLGRTFATDEDYVTYPGRLLPEFPAAKNLLLHLRDRLRRGGALPVWTDYPRATLQRALVSALAGGETGLKPAAKILGSSEDVAAVERAYRNWWRYYN